MRVLVANKFFWPKGGSERVMFDLMAGYERAGHEVVPFSMKSAQNVSNDYEAYFVDEVDYGAVRGFSRVSAALNAVWSGAAKRKLEALIAKVRPDVAHLHNFHHQLSPSIVDGLREAGVPAVHTLHDYKVICPNYLLYTQNALCERCKGGRFWEAIRHRCVRGEAAPSVVAAVEMHFHRWRRTLERGIHRFVSPSRFLRDKLVEFGEAAERVAVVPNGLDLKSVPPGDGEGDGFLFAGRLSREKGVETLLRAVASTSSVRLTVAGTGPVESELRSMAAPLEGRVDFVGHLDRDELLGRVREARAVVLPSEWYENAPMSALESLASATPVIATSLGGLPEIVRNDETGRVVPPGDAGALGRALCELSEHPGRARRWGQRGREVVAEEYTLDRQVSRMLQVLEEAACASR